MMPGEKPRPGFTWGDLTVWAIGSLMMWAAIVTFIKADGWLGLSLVAGAMFVVGAPALFAWSDGATSAPQQER